MREKFLMSRLLEDWLDLLATYERPLCQGLRRIGTFEIWNSLTARSRCGLPR